MCYDMVMRITTSPLDTPLKQQGAIEVVCSRGPVRVLVSSDGQQATTPKTAQVLYGVVPEVVFFRYDGWTLGATTNDEQAAFRMWPAEWVGFARDGGPYQPIAEYQVPK